MKKTALIIITLGLILAIGIIVLGGANKDNNTNQKTNKVVSEKQIPNSEIIDGVQYITINAKGGYSPRLSSAKAGIPTKLIIKTKDTYDCSSFLRINPLGYQKVLPQNGEEIIDIGTPVAGQPFGGICSMGMYNFEINFE